MWEADFYFVSFVYFHIRLDNALYQNNECEGYNIYVYHGL